MRRNIKYKSKYLNELKNIIIKHINLNLKDYLILSIIFIIGVMIGVIIINNSDENSKLEINGYINSFIEIIKSETYEIDKLKLIKISIIDNLKTVLIIWIAGTTVIGIPLIYIITAYKGFCMGYTIAAIISTLGTWNRNVFFICVIVFTEHNYYTNNTNVKCKCPQII